MIPESGVYAEAEIEIVQMPSLTYRLDFRTNRIMGRVDGIEAVKQAIFKILNTERYEYLIYSWNYGVELNELIGEDLEVAYTELSARISEALLQDERILSVEAFSFEKIDKQTLQVNFHVETVEGELALNKVVNI